MKELTNKEKLDFKLAEYLYPHKVDELEAEELSKMKLMLYHFIKDGNNLFEFVKEEINLILKKMREEYPEIPEELRFIMVKTIIFDLLQDIKTADGLILDRG